MTSLYADTGIFVWAKSLAEQGSYAPSRKVFVIGKTLALEALRQVTPSECGVQQKLLVDEAVLRGTARFSGESMLPLAELQLSSEPSWDPYGALVELMVADCGAQAIRSVKSRLNSAGISLGYAELHDLSTAFVNAHLRAAIRSFDPVRGEGKEGAWLSTVLYRFVLRHALMAHRIESNFDLAFEITDPSPFPEEQIEVEIQEKALKILPAALKCLPETQRRAIALYFGLERREHTIKEVAQSLNTNPYFARLAIISGVMSLAARLDAEGLLSADELLLAKALLVEGESLDSVADKLGMSGSVMKRQMSHITDRVKTSLRRRTVSSKSTSLHGEAEMTKTHDELLVELSGDLIEHRLTIERSTTGRLMVTGRKLKETMTLDRARKLLTTSVDRLVAAEIELEEEAARLFAPEGPRKDLSNEDIEWAALLQNAAQSSLVGILPLVHVWKKKAQEAGLEVTSDEAELTERIRESLATVSSALELSMPRQGRRDGKTKLWIRFGERPDDATFGWLDGIEQSEPVHLLSLVRHRLSLVGDFDGLALALLAQCAVQGLQEGWGVLPRFTWQESRSDTATLLWEKPTL